jgi:putative SOS response-associated peptidase YedK
VLRLNRHTGEREIDLMRSGLIPFCLLDEGPKDRASDDQRKGRDDHDGTSLSRSHQVQAMPGARGRVLRVAADQRKGEAAIRNRSTGQPTLRIRRPLGEVEGPKAGSELLTFTVITTDPDELVEPMHDRMPVIPSGRRLMCCGHLMPTKYGMEGTRSSRKHEEQFTDVDPACIRPDGAV